MSYEEIFIQKEINVTKKQEIKASNSNLVAKISDVDFSVRTLNSLKNENVIYLGDLVCYTEFEIKKFRNMGKKSIDEIKAKLTDFNLYLGMELNDWPPNDINNSFEQINYEKKIINQKIQETSLIELIKNLDETTLSLRAKNALRNLYCNYVGDILLVSKAALFSIPNLGLKSINEIENYINNLNYNFGDKIVPWDEKIISSIRKELLEKISSKKRDELVEKDKFLEVEIMRILKDSIILTGREQIINNRVIDVLISRYGLDGSPAKTLEIIGQKYNVTRERIRQNQSYGIRKLKIKKPFTPILDKTFEILLKSLPITEIEFNKILLEKNLTKQEWDLQGLKNFYEDFVFKFDFYIAKVNGINYINKNNKIPLNYVLNQINKKISNSGIFSISQCMDLKEVYLNNIRRESIKSIIQTKYYFKWLDDDEDYFTYYSNRNRLSNLISKVALTSEKVHFDILFKKIKNFHRLKNITFEHDVFLRFCKICFECKVDENRNLIFYSKKSKLSNYDGYKGDIVAPNERKIINIFKDYGPILSIDDLNELASANNVSKDSLNMMLQFSPLFNRIDIGFYKLTKKMNEKKMDKLISIIDTDSLSFTKEECPVLKGKKTYIEVNKNGYLFKSLPYERPLRSLPDGSYGVVYKKQVFPIIETVIETNGNRSKTKIN